MARSQYKSRFLDALNPQQGRADTAENFYLDKATAFDPTAALDRYAGAAGARFRREAGESIDKVRGQQVGMGRLDTGFATQDEDRILTELGTRQQEDLDSRALDATNLELRNIEGVGGYGERTRGTYLDMLSGGLDRETAEANAKRQMISSILGSVLGAGAYAFGAR